MRVSFVVLAGLLAGCVGVSQPSPPSPPPRTTAAVSVDGGSTTSPPQTVVTIPKYRDSTCEESPPVAFAVLCEAYDEVSSAYVDSPNPSELAAAAVRGLDLVEIADPGPAGAFTVCPLPAPEFTVLCDELASRVASGQGTADQLVTAGVKGMFQYGLDPFSLYLPGAEFGAGFDASGLVWSLGISVATRDDTATPCAVVASPSCSLEILSVFDFTAGDRAGLVVGDVIVAIDGESVEGLTAAEAVVRLTGAPGTAVELTADRDGRQIDRSLVREDIRFEPAELELVGSRVAHIRLNDFSQLAAQRLGGYLQEAEVRSARGLVLDLRDNPGGLVLAAQAVASQFLADGEVFVEQGRGWEDRVPVIEGGLATDVRNIVVLVNRGTASAAEIVAAVLQERGRATVIGERTFGKNLVQEVLPTRDGGEMHITIARWTTPGGRDVVNGLIPDTVIEVVPGAEGDPVLDAAIARLGG